jgi:hypothetical protein
MFRSPGAAVDDGCVRATSLDARTPALADGAMPAGFAVLVGDTVKTLLGAD